MTCCLLYCTEIAIPFLTITTLAIIEFRMLNDMSRFHNAHGHYNHF